MRHSAGSGSGGRKASSSTSHASDASAIAPANATELSAPGSGGRIGREQAMRIEWKKRLLLLCRSRYLLVTARQVVNVP